MTKEKYAALLAAHDWHYDCSEEYSAWRDGSDGEALLLKHAALNPEFDKMYKEFVDGLKKRSVNRLKETR